MKKTGKNIKPIMAVIAIVVTLSVILGVVMAATQTNAPAVDESTGENISYDTSIADSAGSESGASSDGEADNTLTDDSDNNSQGGASLDGSSQSTPSPDITQQPTVPPAADALSDMYSAMWISYLEFQSVDFSSRAAFNSQMTEMFSNCADMGVKTVIVQVRPFGDALYKSDIFPVSHLVNGTQGAALSFDPLEEMVKIAHSLNLRIEAWVNPYRVRLHSKMPDNIAESNPANDAALVFSAEGGVYYNPALTQVQDMVVDGIAEIVEKYDVDGIHLDDYFYPSTDISLDEKDYSASGSKLSQADWRRENVNTLVKKIYKKIKSIDPSVTFGISPQGNNDNNYNVQYSDVCLWMKEAGYVDYIMPQLYWGFGYLTKSGSEDYQFVKLSNKWASYPRHSSVKLYIGMGAYRIGDGDGGTNDQSEWSGGNNLMRMINAVGANGNISGFGLYRYDNLFRNSKYPSLAQSEVEHITELLEN